MSLTLDPEVTEALAPFAADPGTPPPPVGDVATRRATLEPSSATSTPPSSTCTAAA